MSSQSLTKSISVFDSKGNSTYNPPRDKTLSFSLQIKRPTEDLNHSLISSESNLFHSIKRPTRQFNYKGYNKSPKIQQTLDLTKNSNRFSNYANGGFFGSYKQPRKEYTQPHYNRKICPSKVRYIISYFCDCFDHLVILSFKKKLAVFYFNSN